MSRIHLTIDSMHLKGISADQQRTLVSGLRSELSRVLANPAARAAWARSHRTPVLKLGRMPLESGAAGGTKLGGGIARAIGRGLKP